MKSLILILALVLSACAGPRVTAPDSRDIAQAPSAPEWPAPRPQTSTEKPQDAPVAPPSGEGEESKDCST